MKKIVLTVIAAVALCGTLSAGGFGWGVKAGVNVSKMSDLRHAKSKAGFTGGLFVDYKLAMLGISADLLYSGQGSKFETAADADVTTKTHYLNVPILANFYLLPGLAVKAGIQPSFLLGAKSKTEQGGSSTTTDVKKGFRNADFSIPVGLSFEFMRIILDARYNIGVTNVTKPSLGDVKSKNNYFSITAGVRF